MISNQTMVDFLQFSNAHSFSSLKTLSLPSRSFASHYTMILHHDQQPDNSRLPMILQCSLLLLFKNALFPHDHPPLITLWYSTTTSNQTMANFLRFSNAYSFSSSKILSLPSSTFHYLRYNTPPWPVTRQQPTSYDSPMLCYIKDTPANHTTTEIASGSHWANLHLDTATR